MGTVLSFIGALLVAGVLRYEKRERSGRRGKHRMKPNKPHDKRRGGLGPDHSKFAPKNNGGFLAWLEELVGFAMVALCGAYLVWGLAPTIELVSAVLS
jgi:hypothetical protein